MLPLLTRAKITKGIICHKNIGDKTENIICISSPGFATTIARRMSHIIIIERQYTRIKRKLKKKPEHLRYAANKIIKKHSSRLKCGIM